MRRECEIKRMSRKEKLELIRGQVPKKGMLRERTSPKKDKVQRENSPREE